MAFLETTLGWAVPGLDPGGRMALVADMHAQMLIGGGETWPGPGDTVYVECRPLRIGGAVAHMSACLLVPVGDSECFALAEATAVCSIPPRKRQPARHPTPHSPNRDAPGPMSYARI